MYIPFYRSWGFPAYGFGYPWGFGSFGTNIVGSAIANQSLINTGSIVGVSQIATPTVECPPDCLRVGVVHTAHKPAKWLEQRRSHPA